jgi:hypothetical protein
MTMPMPPQLEAAYGQISESLAKALGRPVDLATDDWALLEKGVIQLLGGPFNPTTPEHQVVALGLSAGLAARLYTDHQAFWFPFRETPEGASLGFPDALVMLSPFGAVVDALRSARLEKLSDVQKEIRSALAQVKFSGQGGAVRLAAEDYMRLFDPAFVQLVAMDPVKMKATWELTPTRISMDLRDAISRAGKLSPEVKKQLEQQFGTALSRLDPGRPLIQQVLKAPRIVESMALLFGSVASTGAAAEEFWTDVVMPLLFVGTPATFPPLDQPELEVAKQGIDPLFLFLDVVPYQHQAPDEEGLLGAFPAASLALPDAAFEQVQQLRLIKVGLDAVRPALEAFDAGKSRDAIERFAAMVREKTGPTPAAGQGAEEAKMMIEAAIRLLVDLKGLLAGGKELYLRRLTEAEAASEPALAQVRQAASGPRIILAT